jgi:hypothetical protein
LWEQIAGTKFDSSGLCRMGHTVAAIVPTRSPDGLGNEHWEALGRVLRLVDPPMKSNANLQLDVRLVPSLEEAIDQWLAVRDSFKMQSP